METLAMQINGITLEKMPRMKSGTKRWLGSLAVAAAGTLGTAFLIKKRSKSREAAKGDRWARPGMSVTFRAELMPGRDASERTFRVKTLLPSDRVLLDGVSGEHARGEFERLR